MKDITFEGIKNALERATTKVDSLKHATPQAKNEFNEFKCEEKENGECPFYAPSCG